MDARTADQPTAPEKPKTFAEQINSPESFQQVTGMCTFFGALTYYVDHKGDRVAIRSAKHDGAFILFTVRKPLDGDSPHTFATTDLEQHLRNGNDGVTYYPVRGKMTLPPQFSKRFIALPAAAVVCPQHLALDQADFANPMQDGPKYKKQLRATAEYIVKNKMIDRKALIEFAERIANTFEMAKVAYGRAFDKMLLLLAQAHFKAQARKAQEPNVIEQLVLWHQAYVDTPDICECGGSLVQTQKMPRKWHCFTCSRSYVETILRMPAGKTDGPLHAEPPSERYDVSGATTGRHPATAAAS
jgi:hypothetical protein